MIEAAKAAMDSDTLGYTDSFGIPALREAIARHYRDWYGVDIPFDRIAATTGSSGGFVLSFLSAFDPGDRVATVAPGYPCYRNILGAFGIEPVILEGSPADRYQPTPALLDAAHSDAPLDGLIVASPSNPTGTVLGAEAFPARFRIGAPPGRCASFRTKSTTALPMAIRRRAQPGSTRTP